MLGMGGRLDSLAGIPQCNQAPPRAGTEGRDVGSVPCTESPVGRLFMTAERPVRFGEPPTDSCFSALFDGSSIAQTFSMSASSGSVSEIVHSIGRHFDGNRDGAIKGAEKWAFLNELVSRLELEARAASKTASKPVTSQPAAVAPSSCTGSADQLDLSKVNWLHTNVSNWVQTSTITGVSIGGPPISIEHTKAGQWPAINSGGAVVEGNPWVFVNVDGVWHAATYEWLRPGQTDKQISAANIGAHIKQSPLDNWQPKSGEKIGLMVSTPARLGPEGPVNERSNVVLVTWP